MGTRIKYIPGILLVLVISIISMFLNDFLIAEFNLALEALTIAIIIGILYNNTIGTSVKLKDGITFSLKKLLKVGIVLLGFKLNFAALLSLGPKILMMVIIYIPVALILSVLLGKLFKIDTKLATLIGVGSSICGASAIVAMTPCINADDEDSVIAVSIVSFLGAIGVLAYSAIAVSNIGLSDLQYGVWSGLTLHGVAHAIAAAFARGDASGDIGTFVKMTRVLMLVPVSLILSFIFNRNANSEERKKVKFPMYVLYFVVAGIINSLGILPPALTNVLKELSSLFILMAMTAMGLSVSLKSIIGKGLNALIMSSIMFTLLSSVALMIIFQII
ncbi:YeiH family protein [Vallitalea okinawensis]|uniref:YeiH family protein n=1 Tax=Vallitalea okinawensis TaxID=2078660 RepID=UPI000CFCE412|nr:putative sulfate exporter family transporter [Vallitalea okinawensis]